MKVPDPFFGPKGIRLLLVFRGLSGFFGLFGTYYSLQYLSLSDATVLAFLAPMCTAVTGAIILKEDFTRNQALAGIFSLLGVVLIARPAFLFGSDSYNVSPSIDDGLGQDLAPANAVTPAQRLGAIGVALLGVLGVTGSYTTIRAIGKRAHPMHNIVAFSSQCVLASTIAILITQPHIVVPTRLDWLAMLLAVGVFGFFGQILMTMGLQRETAGRGTMAVYIQIIFAMIFERIFFHTTPPPLSIVGTIIIIASAMYVAVTKQVANREQDRGIDISLRDALLEEGLLNRQDDSVANATTILEDTNGPPGLKGSTAGREIPERMELEVG